MYDNPTNFTVYREPGVLQDSGRATASDLVELLEGAGLGHHRYLLAEAGGVRTALEVNMLSARHPFVFSVDNNEYHRS